MALPLLIACALHTPEPLSLATKALRNTANISILDYNKARDQYRATGNINPVNQVISSFNAAPGNRVSNPLYGPSGTPQAGASTPSGNTSLLDTISQHTRNAYSDQLNAENSLFDQRAATLNNQLDTAGREKDSLLDRIGTTFSGLVQSAKDTLTKNVGLLEGRKGEVNQQYDTARTNEARLLGDQQRINRQLGRAQGTLGSSYYGNMQSAAGRTATQRISGLNTEESSKIDAIGNAILNANTDTNTKIDTLELEQANAEQDIVNKYTATAEAIRTDLRFNDRDKIDALRAVNNRMASALDNIGQLFGQYQTAATSLGTKASTFGQQIASYDPFGGEVGNTLATNDALAVAGTPLQDNSGAAATTNPNFLSSIFGYYDPRDPRNRQGSFLDYLG